MLKGESAQPVDRASCSMLCGVAQSEGHMAAAASTDIRQAFGKVQRELLCVWCVRDGVPAGVVDARHQFQSHRASAKSIIGTEASTYHMRAYIPQGCPCQCALWLHSAGRERSSKTGRGCAQDLCG